MKNLNTVDPSFPTLEDELLEEIKGSDENFSEVEVQEFKEEFGQVTGSLEDDYFLLESDNLWLPTTLPNFSERQQRIADYLRVS